MADDSWGEQEEGDDDFQSVVHNGGGGNGGNEFDTVGGDDQLNVDEF